MQSSEYGNEHITLSPSQTSYHHSRISTGEEQVEAFSGEEKRDEIDRKPTHKSLAINFRLSCSSFPNDTN
jgi:hypothetical protein